MKIPLLLAASLFSLPCWSADIFRCASETGAVEYRDWPCAPGTGGKATIEDDSPSPTDQAKALRRLEEQSQAFDARTRARAELAQRQYENELRERALIERVAQESPAPEAEPYFAYVPFYADACVGRHTSCGRPPAKRHLGTLKWPDRPSTVEQTQHTRTTNLRAARPLPTKVSLR